MRRTAAAILALAALSDATSARAEFPKFEIPRLGIFRKKKEDPPAPPKQQPGAQPEAMPAKPANPAIATLRTDRDEKDRAAAAVALRTADPRNDLDVLPTLMTSLQQDPSPTVRAAVAETIGKLKPVSAEAGATLEAVVMGDPSEAVRKAAQAALWQYHLNGYRSSAANAAVPQTAEPPLARPKTIAPAAPVPAVLTSTVKPQAMPAPVPAPVARPISTGIGRGAIYPQTIEPPLAKPKTEVKPPVPSIEVPKFREEPPAEEKKELKDAKPVVAEVQVIPVPAAAPAIPVVPPAPTVLTIPPPPMK
ncbi:MAG: HEAT repeat domain-containing protein [Gemmataceae bacterium]|nr:HEAT repeat domain-containing protein [Gemmataceae bacterium]